MSFERAMDPSRSPSWKRLLWAFLVIYLLALLFLVPARLVFDWLEPRAALSLSEPRGTLWQGQVEGVESLEGLRSLAWRFAPGALFEGRLGYQLKAGEGVLQGAAAVAPGGQVTVEALRIDGRLSQLFASLDGVPRLYDVHLNGLVETFGWSDEGCVELEGGRVLMDNWSGLLGGRFNPLGGAMLTLSCNEGRLEGAVTAGSPQAGLSGNLSLGADGAYALDLSAKPGNEELRALYLDLGFRPQGQALVFQRRGRLAL